MGRGRSGAIWSAHRLKEALRRAPRRKHKRNSRHRMKVEDYQERLVELSGWPVRLTSYKLGDEYVCEADNVSPGARLARFAAATQEEAEAQATSKARHLLSKTVRHSV